MQAPSIAFPIEAHTGLPFRRFYPENARSRPIQGWEKRRPGYGAFIAGTRVLRRRGIEKYSPDATIEVKKVLGFTKSYTVWRAA